MQNAALKHLLTIDVAITDDFLERRTKAANATAARWRKMASSTAAIEKASALADAMISASTGAPIPAALRQEVGADIKRHAPTHDADNAAHDFEVAIVAAVAAIMVLDGAAARTGYCEVFAEALSTAMGIAAAKGTPKVAAVWNDLFVAARTVSDTVAERRRDRVLVDQADTPNALRALAENDLKNAEEIDVLWWTLNDWSALGQQAVSESPPPVGVVTAAVELSQLLSWPAARAHRQLAHRNLSDRNAALELLALALEPGPVRERVDAALSPVIGLVRAHPRIFVALMAVSAADAADAAARLAPMGVDPNQSRPAWAWCERLVRELSLAKSAGGKVGPVG